MENLSTDTLIELAFALGIGVFIGLEREHSDQESHAESDGDSPNPRTRDAAIGVRTFSLLSLLGWILAVSGTSWPWLPPVGLGLVGALVISQYLIARESGVGITTEAAALMTFVLGMTVHRDRALAVALSLFTLLLLISKPWMRDIVARTRRVELTGALQLLILFAIVLPLLPDETVDPWNALPARKIGLFVVLLSGLSFVGYLSTRIFGRRLGVGLTGFFGGLASSTAVTVTMSRAGHDSVMRRPAQMAVLIANFVMFFRVLIVTSVVSLPVARELAPALVPMGLVMLTGAGWCWRETTGEASSAQVQSQLSNPFALLPALKWGLVLSVVLVAAALAQEWFGDAGTLAAAAVSGLADVDAITIAVSEGSASQTLSTDTASAAVVVAVISNTVVKAALAVLGGGRKFARPILVVFAASVATGGILLVLL